VERIVIVEDEQLISTMLKLNLQRAGYEVVCFGEAEPMLEYMEEETCDILLLDIMLPGMSGDDALKLLRERGCRVPVLMLTARHDMDLKVGTLSSGADDYITKPFDMNELLARVGAHLRRRKD